MGGRSYRIWRGESLFPFLLILLLRMTVATIGMESTRPVVRTTANWVGVFPPLLLRLGMARIPSRKFASVLDGLSLAHRHSVTPSSTSSRCWR